MSYTVGVVRGTEKLAAFDELLAITRFDEVLSQAHAASGKSKEAFRIVIKPNMMALVDIKTADALVTDRELVEHLVDHVRAMGFTQIAVVESQMAIGQMLKNHTPLFIADKLGYRPQGRYKLVDLTEEMVKFHYTYLDHKGRTRKWKDVVGPTWRDADFRISFAKCKTHDHERMTLAVKCIYGCFPEPNKVNRYHIRHEVADITARSLRTLPLHFAFVDGWIASDGFQGYKFAHPKELKMLFGGSSAIAVDMEICKRAGLNPREVGMLREAVYQVHGGVFPEYTVVGDKDTLFSQLVPWENVHPKVVEGLDAAEEIYLSWVLLNVEAAAERVDFNMFPPKNAFYRLVQYTSRWLNRVFNLTRLYDKYFGRGTARQQAQLAERSSHP